MPNTEISVIRMKTPYNQTFSYKTKSEICGNITGRKRCDACLLGMLLYANTLEKDNIIFQTENDVVKDLFIRLVNHACDSDKSVSATQFKRRGRPMLYSLRIERPSFCTAVLDRVGIDTDMPSRCFSDNRLPKEKDLGAFVAGIFLACGSVLSPEKEYHLEFVINDLNLCNDLALLFIDRLNLVGKYAERKSVSVMYFKGSESVEDVLTLVGAPMAALEVMNVEILKDVRNHVNRAANCTAGNAKKQSATAWRQIEAIERIDASEDGLAALPDELRVLAEIRLENPDMTLSELAKQFDPPLSKSGINHRLARIEAFAELLK